MNSNTNSTPTNLRIFVFDSPRTCSHLFRRLFLTHPQLGHILEPYIPPSIFGREGVTPQLGCSEAASKVVEDMKVAMLELSQVTYEGTNVKLGEEIEGIESEGKIPWIKDHAIYSVKPEIILSTLRSNMSVDDVFKNYSNPTTINETLLDSFTPIFLIRHPALVVQSYWEVNLKNIHSDIRDELFIWMTSVRWVRILFDFFRKKPDGVIPMVVDAEDVVHHTEELADRICERLGIKREGVVLEWEAYGQFYKWGDFFKERLQASKGVERDAKGPAEKQLDLDVVTAEWKQKYGGSVGAALRQSVEEEMPDYQYLRQFKLLS